MPVLGFDAAVGIHEGGHTLAALVLGIGFSEVVLNFADFEQGSRGHCMAYSVSAPVRSRLILTAAGPTAETMFCSCWRCTPDEMWGVGTNEASDRFRFDRNLSLYPASQQAAVRESVLTETRALVQKNEQTIRRLAAKLLQYGRLGYDEAVACMRPRETANH